MPFQLEWYAMHFPDHVVGAMICIIAPLLVAGSRRMGEEEFSFGPDDKIRLYHQNALFLTVVALAVITVWRIPGRSLAWMGFSMPVWSGYAWWVLVAIGLFYLGDLAAQYFMHKRDAWQEARKGAGMILPATNRELGHFLFLSVAAGVGEEIIFRGFLMHYLVFWFGHTPTDTLAAGFFSAVIFARLHGYQGWVAMIKILFLAMLFAALFVLTRSLWPVIIIHALIDMVSGWLGVRWLRPAGDTAPPEE